MLWLLVVLLFVDELLGLFVFIFFLIYQVQVLTAAANIFNNIVERKERDEFEAVEEVRNGLDDCFEREVEVYGLYPLKMDTYITGIDITGALAPNTGNFSYGFGFGFEKEGYKYDRGAAVIPPPNMNNNCFEGKGKEDGYLIEALLRAIDTANNNFIGGLFAALFSAIEITIVGILAAVLAVLISNFGGFISGGIGDMIDCNNGYNFTAKVAACLPMSNGLFTLGIGAYCLAVYGVVAVICGALSSIYGLISGFCGYATAPATDTTYDNGFNDNGSGPRGAAIIGTIGRYFKGFNGYFRAALTAITVIAVLVAVGIGFELKGVFPPPQQATVTTATIGIRFEYEPNNGVFATTNNGIDYGLSPSITEIGFEFLSVFNTPITAINEINDILENEMNENKIILNENENEIANKKILIFDIVKNDSENESVLFDIMNVRLFGLQVYQIFILFVLIIVFCELFYGIINIVSNNIRIVNIIAYYILFNIKYFIFLSKLGNNIFNYTRVWHNHNNDKKHEIIVIIVN